MVLGDPKIWAPYNTAFDVGLPRHVCYNAALCELVTHLKSRLLSESVGLELSTRDPDRP